MIVETALGRIEGTRTEEGPAVFRGIPYAKSPTGPRRWHPAEPLEAWTGTLDARGIGTCCPQPPAAGLAAAILPAQESSENCLTLTIHCPADVTGSRPVAVWVHGGGFLSGSSAWPAGDAFARDGIVLVSINYRIGPFGFLALDELLPGCAGSGNLGLGDQLEALRWVRAHIASFGGDPGNVTLFGESAGAISAASLMVTEDSRGLFRRAILQSGALDHWRSAEGATQITRLLLEKSQLTAASDLRSLPADDLVRLCLEKLLMDPVAVSETLKAELPQVAGMPFSPVADGLLLPEDPLAALEAGAASGIDLIIGVNSDEWRLVHFADRPPPRDTPPDIGYIADAIGMSTAALLAAYRDLLPGTGEHDVYCEIMGDLQFRVPAHRLAAAQAPHARVFQYEFSWKTPIQGGALGACHAVELPFVFDRLDADSALVGEGAPQALADSVHAHWVNFMTSGEVSEWPRYTIDQRLLMQFDHPASGVRRERDERLRLWSGL